MEGLWDRKAENSKSDELFYCIMEEDKNVESKADDGDLACGVSEGRKDSIGPLV